MVKENIKNYIRQAITLWINKSGTTYNTIPRKPIIPLIGTHNLNQKSRYKAISLYHIQRY